METNEPHTYYTEKQIYIQPLSPFLLTHRCIIAFAVPPGSSGALCCVTVGNAVISVYGRKREREKEPTGEGETVNDRGERER